MLARSLHRGTTALQSLPLFNYSTLSRRTLSNVEQVDLVGVGLNATDTLIPVAHYPARGDKVGGDSAAALHAAEFSRLGVEAHLLTAPDCPSQQAFILIDDSGERTVLWRRDHRLALRPEELQRDWITSARALHLDGHDTAAAAQAAAWARAAGVPVIADLDELYPGVEALLPNVDYLITSRDIPGKLATASGESSSGNKAIPTREGHQASPDVFNSFAALQQSLPAVHRRFGCRLTAATLGTDGV